MRPSQHQPDLNALPPTQGMPISPGSSQYFGQTTSHDSQIDDVMYPESNHDESPTKEGGRGLNLNFLMSKSKTTKDGVPAKKRGPKRDSKPAISRRQELNRQAQRTHRERKEFYTKTLELDVGRLRERYAGSIKATETMQRQLEMAQRQLLDMENLSHENERLKQLLTVNGITFDRLVPFNHAQPPISQPQTATYPNGQMQYPQQQQFPHNHAHQHPMPNHRTNLNHRQNPFPTNPMETHPPYRQQMVGSMPAFPQRDHLQNMSNVPTVTTPSQISASEVSSRGPHGPIPHSTSASSGYGSSVPTPVSATGSDRPSPTNTSSAISRQTSCQELSGTIDTMISPTSSMFYPTANQAADNGRNARDTSDVRIKQEALDRDQLGVEFVLALEENCKDHQQYLNLRANPPAEQDMNFELSGHAMMLTNPPPSHIEKTPNVEYHQAPDIPPNNLLELMEIAQRLPLNGGEIPPILALRIIREDERYPLLTRRQFQALTAKLRESSRCYGFGAVLEQYEVRDALDYVLNHLGR